MAQFSLQHIGTNDMVANKLSQGFKHVKLAMFIEQLGLRLSQDM